jgi:hypothetical protein
MCCGNAKVVHATELVFGDVECELHFGGRLDDGAECAGSSTLLADHLAYVRCVDGQLEDSVGSEPMICTITSSGRSTINRVISVSV